MAEVRMDYEAVEKLSQGFGTAADVLKAVSTALEVAINILRATAFVGLIGGFAVQMYLERIQPEVEKLADICDELSLDLLGAITSIRDGDTEGSQRFV